eukprot:353842-Chlamydomonas_euryale.AAC.4
MRRDARPVPACQGEHAAVADDADAAVGMAAHAQRARADARWHGVVLAEHASAAVGKRRPQHLHAPAARARYCGADWRACCGRHVAEPGPRTRRGAVGAARRRREPRQPVRAQPPGARAAGHRAAAARHAAADDRAVAGARRGARQRAARRHAAVDAHRRRNHPAREAAGDHPLPLRAFPQAKAVCA